MAAYARCTASCTALAGLSAALLSDCDVDLPSLTGDCASSCFNPLNWLKIGAAAKATTTVRNGHLAGKVHPKTGIPFDGNGFPDFSGVAQKTVQIQQTKNRAADYAAANRAAGLPSTPRGLTWHHHQDGKTMQLVPTDIHRGTGHTGGVALGGGGP